MVIPEDQDPIVTSPESIALEPPKKKKKKRKRKGKKQTLNKNSLAVLRTTLRNNIELTSIADNKANVLLSLNALMLTFFGPIDYPIP